MPRDLRMYVHDALEACRALAEFSRGKSLSDYESDALLRSAVERQFCIIGEAMFQAEKLDADLASRITDLRQIINFRHILIHGYYAIEHDIVWGIIESQLVVLNRELVELSKILDDDAAEQNAPSESDGDVS